MSILPRWFRKEHSTSEGVSQESAAPSPWHQVGSILLKDLVTEARTWEMLSAMLVFGALMLLIFSLALDVSGQTAHGTASGILWSAVVLAGTLGLSRSMERERRTASLDGLLLAPMDRTVIFAAKSVGNLIVMLLVELVLIPLAMLLLRLPPPGWPFVLVLLLGTTGYALSGTLVAAIAVGTSSREVLLPVLLLPASVPLLIAAVRSTEALVGGGSLAGVRLWLNLLVVYDLVVLAVALLTFDALVEES